MQLLSNIILSSCIFLLVASGVMINYAVTKFFNISQAAIIALASYLSYLFFIRFDYPIFFSITFSIICSVVISAMLEIVVFRTMRQANHTSAENGSYFKMLIASIGLYTILQNLISLGFGDDTKSVRTGDVKVGNEIMGAYITDFQIITIVVSTILFAAVLLLLQKTRLGQQIRAVSNNPELCNIYGIDSDRIILWATVISSTLAAVAGILIAFDVDMTPTFGFNYYLYGIVAMVIGGVGSYRGLILGSLLLASAQHLAAFYIDTKWMDAVAYFILILFLTWKPLGFSGLRLKKIEV